jgi:hypothetical protein
VVAERLSPVSSDVAVTVAPTTTAPAASTTLPAIVPLVACANPVEPAKKATQIITNPMEAADKLRSFFIEFSLRNQTRSAGLAELHLSPRRPVTLRFGHYPNLNSNPVSKANAVIHSRRTANNSRIFCYLHAGDFNC